VLGVPVGSGGAILVGALHSNVVRQDWEAAALEPGRVIGAKEPRYGVKRVVTPDGVILGQDVWLR
jgi:hypothetical protein